MRAGIAMLVAGYVLSQFYRAFLPVMTPVLQADLGATPEALGRASGLWFLAFAAMQVPVGWALDQLGPRRTAAWLLGLGAGGGAVLFALASEPWHIQAAMVLMGIGCSPVLMGAFFIIAKTYSPKVFGTLAGAVIGIGSIGNIAGSLPMAWSVESFGWRETLWGLSVLTLVVAVLILVLLRDPPRAADHGTQKGSMLTLLAMPALWAIFPLMFVNYAPSAGLRGLWAGPYLSDVFGMDAAGIGKVTLAMGIAMIVGNFAYGPLDRIFGTRKWVILVGNFGSAAAVFTLWFWPVSGVWAVTLLLAATGLFGASFPLIMAHARAFFPPHLTGRGVSLMNLFGIGGVGLFQFSSGWVFEAAKVADGDPVAAYRALFLFFGLPVLVGLVVYLFSRDRLD
ncbi:MFS transporter [Maritimibacter sp. HL-12]|uniref:MFS transporter n=1 Tax=Maritimibacter sp. HL-12 TaxID=1162418 RepID=UPI000A0F23E6|nr:MFS transporter [Maritimibacter sp. HL-12]SMH48037.1 Predicted arabinose efflux permease, MFS family [Maritimibacter sp. HL-12]